MAIDPSPANSPTTHPLVLTMASFLRNRVPKSVDAAEFEQAIIRLVFAFGIVVFFIFEELPHLGGPKADWTETDRVLAIGLAAFWLIAIGIVAAIFVRPTKSVARRIVAMLADVGVATFYVWLAGENGAFMIAAYLFLIFGYGFRFGPRYLYGCQAMSIVGFGAAGFMVPVLAAALDRVVRVPLHAIRNSSLRWGIVGAGEAGAHA